MRRTFLFDFDDTLAGFAVYNTWVYISPIKIFPPVGGLLPGAEEVLDFLLSRGDDLKMVTLNIVLDEEKKWKKLERLGLRKYFNEDNVWMVREKTPDLFREICRGKNPNYCTMVGNSVINDIRPALDAGIKAIFIPRPIFKRVLPIGVDDPNCLVLRRIDQIIDRYDEL
jgi:FMN phosphatase YigB (HAD superfamily)